MQFPYASMRLRRGIGSWIYAHAPFVLEDLEREAARTRGEGEGKGLKEPQAEPAKDDKGLSMAGAMLNSADSSLTWKEVRSSLRIHQYSLSISIVRRQFLGLGGQQNCPSYSRALNLPKMRCSQSKQMLFIFSSQTPAGDDSTSTSQSCSIFSCCLVPSISL